MRDARGVVIVERGAPRAYRAHRRRRTRTGGGPRPPRPRTACATPICGRSSTATGDRPFPMLLGHEAAGIVEEVGDGVDHVAPGDRVLLAWAVPCGTCAACRRGRPRRCDHAWAQPQRLHTADGRPLIGTLSIGGLATHTVVHAAQVIPVPEGLELEAACLLGCGASTGIGAAVNTAPVRTGRHGRRDRARRDRAVRAPGRTPGGGRAA